MSLVSRESRESCESCEMSVGQTQTQRERDNTITKVVCLRNIKLSSKVTHD